MAGLNSSSNSLLSLIDSLISTDYNSITEKILEYAINSAGIDGYIFISISDNNYLNLENGWIKSLNLHALNPELAGLFPSRSINDIKNKKKRSPAETCALTHEIMNISNFYAHPDLDTSAFSKFDEICNYSTISALVIPLIDRKNNPVGIVEFINNLDSNGKNINFTSEDQNELLTLCKLLTVTLENKKLGEDYTQLLESFIEVLARAIDAKSPYTGAHCQRVPIIARLLATAVIEQDSGKYKDFTMSDTDLYTLHIASWLHDCGKITTPEYIVDKASKLEGIFNRIHEIRDRFEILRRDAHILYLQKRLQNTDSKENLQAEYINTVKQLENDFAFIAKCNTGDIPLTDEDISRLEELSKIQFVRYFNRMLGLSWAERERIKDTKLFSEPAKENLLQNRPDHIAGIYNYGELYNLSIPRGTINKEEREKINEHIVVTIEMLKALPFPKELSNIVEYAGAHHERIDGKGYPNGLTGEQMSVPAKIMAIADIFEALTASDRPYKEPKKLSEVLGIMKEMKNNGHIDPDLYDIFIRSRVFQEYANQYIKSEQIDEINIEDYL